MSTEEKSASEAAHEDMKAILAELDEIFAIKYDDLDSEQIAKNNEKFIQLLDRLNEFKPVL